MADVLFGDFAPKGKLPRAWPHNAGNLPFYAASSAKHDGQSLNGDWRYVGNPYETGFYDYRLEQRDRLRNRSLARSLLLGVKLAKCL